jgi:hypothetical protein
MMTKKRILAVSVVLVVLFLWQNAWAGNDILLKGLKPHPGASGTAYFDGDDLSIKAKGLRANEVYTVWFVNMKPKKHETGVGQAPYMFTTDAYGNGAFDASLKEAPFGKWQMLMVVLHPDRNPKDMKNMVGALVAKLPAKS